MRHLFILVLWALAGALCRVEERVSPKEPRVRDWEGGDRGAGSRVGGSFGGKDEPEFVDYRDKWGSNNDHDWDADGDVRWDL